MSREPLRRLYTPHLGRFLALVAADWIAIAAGMAAIALFSHPVVWIFAVLLIGTRQHALLILGHDGTHYLASRNRRRNDRITRWLCLWPLGACLSGYRRFHFAHHRHAGTEADPERQLKAGKLYDGTGRPIDFLYRPLRALFGLELPRYFDQIRALQPCALREAGMMILFHTVVLVALAVLGQLWIAAVWWLAVLTVCWAAFSVREWGEHVGIEGTHRLRVPRALRWLCYPHRCEMHYEHHEYPHVPCWRLHVARRLDPRVPIVDLVAVVCAQLRGQRTGAGPSALAAIGARGTVQDEARRADHQRTAV